MCSTMTILLLALEEICFESIRANYRVTFAADGALGYGHVRGEVDASLREHANVLKPAGFARTGNIGLGPGTLPPTTVKR